MREQQNKEVTLDDLEQKARNILAKGKKNAVFSEEHPHNILLEEHLNNAKLREESPDNYIARFNRLVKNVMNEQKKQLAQTKRSQTIKGVSASISAIAILAGSVIGSVLEWASLSTAVASLFGTTAALAALAAPYLLIALVCGYLFYQAAYQYYKGYPKAEQELQLFEQAEGEYTKLWETYVQSLFQASRPVDPSSDQRSSAARSLEESEDDRPEPAAKDSPKNGKMPLNEKIGLLKEKLGLLNGKISLVYNALLDHPNNLDLKNTAMLKKDITRLNRVLAILKKASDVSASFPPAVEEIEHLMDVLCKAEGPLYVSLDRDTEAKERQVEQQILQLQEAITAIRSNKVTQKEPKTREPSGVVSQAGEPGDPSLEKRSSAASLEESKDEMPESAATLHAKDSRENGKMPLSEKIELLKEKLRLLKDAPVTHRDDLVPQIKDIVRLNRVLAILKKASDVLANSPEAAKEKKIAPLMDTLCNAEGPLRVSSPDQNTEAKERQVEEQISQLREAIAAIRPNKVTQNVPKQESSGGTSQAGVLNLLGASATPRNSAALAALTATPKLKSYYDEGLAKAQQKEQKEQEEQVQGDHHQETNAENPAANAQLNNLDTKDASVEELRAYFDSVVADNLAAAAKYRTPSSDTNAVVEDSPISFKKW